MTKTPMILDGKETAHAIELKLINEIAKKAKRSPCLAVILVGDHAPSSLYVQKKKEACSRIGIRSLSFNLNESISQAELIRIIAELNHDDHVDGILVQLPLPQHISTKAICEAISPEKDVDGFHPINMGKLLMGIEGGFVPCTPLGVKMLLDAYQISVSNKHVVVLGRSNIVGKPMAALLSQIEPGFDATVTILHRDSPAFVPICQSADILIVAVGRPRQIQPSMVKEDVILIDIGIHRLEGQKIVGDVDFENIKHKCSYITPVPGGVGPMTIAALLKNTWQAYLKREKIWL